MTVQKKKKKKVEFAGARFAGRLPSEESRFTRERLFIELMTSDCKLEASREGAE